MIRYFYEEQHHDALLPRELQRPPRNGREDTDIVAVAAGKRDTHRQWSDLEGHRQAPKGKEEEEEEDVFFGVGVIPHNYGLTLPLGYR